MAQKLIQPLNNAGITASYKWGTKYESSYGFTHYGQDLVGLFQTDPDAVYAQGSGIVAFAGWDNVCGNVVGIIYDEAVNHFDGGSYKVVGRYFHLASIKVSQGQRVTKDTQIGVVGATGQYVDGKHLHVEMDKDINYPNYTPTLSGDSNILKAGYRGSSDTSIDPMLMMHCKESHPDYQYIKVMNGSDWVDPRDAQIPHI